MSVLVLLLALVVLFALSGVVGHYDARVRKHGPHALAWRWLFAQANWHGQAGHEPGLDPAGHEGADADRVMRTAAGTCPGWQHALWRIQWTLVTLLTCAGLLFQSRRTAEYLAVTAAAGAGYGAWRAGSWVQEYSHRKNYVKPLHARLADDAGIPLANKPESWLEIPRDLSLRAC